MADITLQNITSTGLDPVYVAANVAGDAFAADARAFLHVKNGGGSSITVTVVAHVVCNQGQLHNIVVTVPNADDRLIGPFDLSQFTLGNQINVTYSGVTSVTVAALKLP